MCIPDAVDERIIYEWRPAPRTWCVRWCGHVIVAGLLAGMESHLVRIAHEWRNQAVR